MSDIVLLDAGPLGMISHPRIKDEVADWLARILSAGIDVLVPEIADYEICRELIRAGSTKGLARLDNLKTSLGFLPITSPAMIRAAEFWAEARRHGRPTASDESLDADVILAAQAATLDGKQVIVASSNPKHIARFTPAEYWQDITE